MGAECGIYYVAHQCEYDEHNGNDTDVTLFLFNGVHTGKLTAAIAAEPCVRSILVSAGAEKGIGFFRTG